MKMAQKCRVLSAIMRQKMFECKCKNVEFGSYDNQIEVARPDFVYGTSETVCLDRCIADEVIHLWEIGISTTGCCCGHGVLEPYIGVVDGDIEKMKNMGYKKRINSMDETREDSFLPKGFCFV